MKGEKGEDARDGNKKKVIDAKAEQRREEGRRRRKEGREGRPGREKKDAGDAKGAKKDAKADQSAKKGGRRERRGTGWISCWPRPARERGRDSSSCSRWSAC